jgi:hypothetical protein
MLLPNKVVFKLKAQQILANLGTRRLKFAKFEGFNLI